MAKKGRDATREAFWRKALRRRERSGLTVVDFCSRESLKPSAFYYWRREIARRDGEQRLSRSQLAGSDGTPRLARVRLFKDREPAGIEITTPNGLVVRVGEEATTEHLRRVLQLVNEIG